MKKFGAVVIGAVTGVLLSATAAQAHQNHITGTVSCVQSTGQQLVTWFNEGDSPRFGDAIISASNRAAVATGQTIPGDTTVQVGSETFANDATGTITLTETWTWPKDQFSNHNSGSVELGIECEQPSSSTPPPTTTPPPTSSTPTPSSSSSTPPPPPTSHSGTPRTETDPTPTPTLAYTGAPTSLLPLGLLAGAFVIVGTSILYAVRRKVDDA